MNMLFNLSNLNSSIDLSCEEPNVFKEASVPFWIKVVMTLFWIVNVACAFVLLHISKYEYSGQMGGQYRPVINQLTSAVNFTVR